MCCVVTDHSLLFPLHCGKPELASTGSRRLQEQADGVLAGGPRNDAEKAELEQRRTRATGGGSESSSNSSSRGAGSSRGGSGGRSRGAGSGSRGTGSSRGGSSRGAGAAAGLAAAAAAAAAAEAAATAAALEQRANKRATDHGTGLSPAGAQKKGPQSEGGASGPSTDTVRLRAAAMNASFAASQEFTELAAHAMQSTEVQRLRAEKDNLELKLSSVEEKLRKEQSEHEITKAELKGISSSTSALVDGVQVSLFEQLSQEKQKVARLITKVKEQKKRIKTAEVAAAHNQAMFLAKLEMDSEKINAFMPKASAESSDED